MAQKDIFGFISTAFMAILLVCIFFLSGCGTPGETKDEVARRHTIIRRTNMLQIQDDIDAIMMLDRPSKLSDKLIR